VSSHSSVWGKAPAAEQLVSPLKSGPGVTAKLEREREREIYLHEKNCRQPKGQMPINAGAYFKSDNQ